MAKKQARMFDAGETLPLFTGTAAQGRVEVYRPKRAVQQQGFGCPVCHDTGVVQVNKRMVRCTCPVGQGVDDDGD